MNVPQALPDPDLAIEAPVRIPKPFMIHTWTDLAMLHCPFESSLIQALLPASLEVDCFDGAAWVGLIPFHLKVRLPAWLPSIPMVSQTLEVNVRTYVRGPDGRKGIWFLSLDAACLPVALVARAWYGIPYTWANLRFHRHGRTVLYQSRRRVPPRPKLLTKIELQLESDLAVDLSPLEQFFACRWRLYSPGRRGIVASQIEHPAWPLFRAHPIDVHTDLMVPLGLTPKEPPAALFSPGVEVLWARRRLATHR